MKTIHHSSNAGNVVDLFTGQPWSITDKQSLIRLAPEHDRLEMLYSNDSNPDKLFAMPVLCWALRHNGEAVGMVPWLNNIVPCPQIKDPLNGQWQGYYDPRNDEIFYEAPLHKVIEMETALQYYESFEHHDGVVQELPDTIGTHAIFSGDGFHTLTLKEVVSWRLLNDGTIEAMVAADHLVNSTPILPGDNCLYAAQTDNNFRYFFQHQIANKIKSQDPEALAAIAQLIEH